MQIFSNGSDMQQSTTILSDWKISLD